MVNRRDVIAAQQRVAELEGFYFHFAAFTIVIALLTGLNAYTGDWWVQWVAFGWGIGVAAHAMAVYASRPKFLVAWERRKFRELARNEFVRK